MTTIDVQKEISRFERHLENNPRTIFSAKFGDGKTSFLNKYMRQHKMNTLFIVLHPINYSVATNEDIFEYVKRDILVELSKCEEFKVVDWDKVKKTLIDYDSVLEECEFMSDAIPVTKAILVPFRLFKKIDDKYAIDKYFSRFSQMKGGIFEHDQFTAAIKATIEKIREKGNRCVLIIEDLDRIDPGHLFRILNVLGAHIDEDNDTNKFGFDNIVAVLDYYTTEHVFHHFYGENADYSGYMAKFSCHNIFEYSIKREARRQLLEVLKNECMMEDIDISQYKWHQDEKFTIQRTIKEQIDKLSVRDIVHILDDLKEQYYHTDLMLSNHKIKLQDIPILKMLAVFVRMNFKFSNDNLYQFLVRSKKSFLVLGDLLCGQQAFNNAKVTFTNNEEYVIHFENMQGNYLKANYEYGAFNHQLKDADLRNAMDTALHMVYSCVHDCKPIA
ncbi:P-loop NTPase fold protein [Pseudobutyrivibrio sp.]|uniref:P-loop NTPase fold protein n=1 Tax=Pseudobutyrivibrio sp. TaxID=2014367 RepID=UPI00386334FE